MLEKVKETVAEALGSRHRYHHSGDFLQKRISEQIPWICFEMAMSSRTPCGVEIPTEDLETMVTVGDVAEYLEQHKN